MSRASSPRRDRFLAAAPRYGLPIGLASAWLGIWMTRAAAASRLAQRR